MARKIFIAIGEKLAVAKNIENPLNVIWLRINETFDFLKGTAVATE